LVLAGWRAVVADFPCADDPFGWHSSIGAIGRIRRIDGVDPAARLGLGFCQQLRRKGATRRTRVLAAFAHTPFLPDAHPAANGLRRLSGMVAGVGRPWLEPVASRTAAFAAISWNVQRRPKPSCPRRGAEWPAPTWSTCRGQDRRRPLAVRSIQPSARRLARRLSASSGPYARRGLAAQLWSCAWRLRPACD